MDQDTANEIATEAYTYLYPLVLMDVTRRQATNVQRSGEMVGRGPANAFAHIRQFPSATWKDVVKPNFDTLYSLAWLHVDQEPMIVSVPDAGDRYKMSAHVRHVDRHLPRPRTRTTGNGAGHFDAVYPASYVD